MTVDVEMPDGTVIEGVPDGMTQTQLMQMLAAKKTSAVIDQGKRDLAQSLPWYEAAMIGAGKMGDSMWGGMKQIGIGLTGAAANAMPDSSVKRSLEDYATQQAGALDQQQRGNAAEYAILARERPFATGLGEAGAMFAIPGGAAVRGAKGAEAIASAAAQGAVPGLLGYGTAQEKGVAGAAGAGGGAVGGAVGIGVGRVINPFRTTNEARTAALKAADDLGLKLTPAEISQSRALKWAQTTVDDLPLASGIGTARREGNASALNSAALRSIGQDGTQITPQALGDARQAIGQVFDDTLSGLKIRLDPQFHSDIMKITGSKVMKELRDDSVDSIIAPFKNLPPGKVAVSGEWFQQNRTALDSAIRAAYTAGQTGKAQALEGFEDALHAAALRSMSDAEREAYTLARKQWANLRLLETGNVVSRDASANAGNVMPKALDNALAARYKSAYREGKLDGDLVNVAKGGMLLREMPNSGTVPRAIYSGGVGGGGMGVMAGVIDPLTAAAAMASPVMAQIGMNNPLARYYTRNGMFGITPEIERMLIRGGAMPGAALGYEAASGR